MFNHIMAESANVLGIIGVILILFTYLMLQLNKMSALSVPYSLLNAAGAILILISLYFYWNLASGIIEMCWLFISLYGCIKAIQRHFRQKRRSK